MLATRKLNTREFGSVDGLPEKVVLDRMHALASIARECANHYNGFKVGASVHAFKTVDGVEVARIFSGFNTKLKSGHCPERCCAEMSAASKALEEGFTSIRRIVVHGLSQPDDTTGKDFNVLICCGWCRNNLRHFLKLQFLITDDTELVFRNAETDFERSFTASELLAECGGDNDPAIEQVGATIHRFGLPK